jgi:hypothetical protein
MIQITSTAGLIGYLQGNMKGIISFLELIPEEKRTYSEKRTLEYLKKAITESDEIWETVKYNKY